MMKRAISKQHVIDEIRRKALENGGVPLGTQRFENETGIKPYDWQKYWARFGDAQREAGFDANEFQPSYDDDLLIEKFAGLMRKLGKFPTLRELGVKRNSDPDFPSLSTFRRFGTKEQFAARIVEFCRGREGYNDISELCASIPRKGQKQ